MVAVRPYVDPWKNIFLRFYMAAAGDYSLLIAETPDVYDRCSGMIVKKGLRNNIKKEHLIFKLNPRQFSEISSKITKKVLPNKTERPKL
jgi:hypothetical protein